jgi:ceramide glucosyltransferase
MILLILTIILVAALVFSWGYWVVAVYCARQFLRGQTTAVGTGEPWLPSVSILKPMKGLDAQTLENFASFCRQDYPDFELLFGVADAFDPAVEVVEQLRGQFPNHDIRLIVCSPGGANPKVGILRRLAAEARGAVLIASDSDMRVGRDYLRRVTAPLQDPNIGIVTCPYVAAGAQGFAGRLEALYVNATFLPGAIIAGGYLGVTVGFGATLALRREDLGRIGGFGGFRDHLADDYQLASRVAALGLKVHLSDYVVATLLGRRCWRGIWDREVRWARGLRVSAPASYLGIPLTFSTPLALAVMLCAGLSPLTFAAFLFSLALRIEVARWISADTRCVRAMVTGDSIHLPWNWMLMPIRDLLTALVWCVGAMGHRVIWRGTTFRLKTDGRLETPAQVVPIRPAPFSPLAFVMWLDRTLRRRQGIYEFTQDPACLLRLSRIRAERSVRLDDGTRVREGDVIGDLHQWNEHLPIIPADGPAMKWAIEMQNGMHHSFRQLAAYVAREPSMQHVEAFHGASSFIGRHGNSQVARMVRRFGMELMDRPRCAGPFARLHELGENILLWMLARAFVPPSAKGKLILSRPRQELWISRRALLAQYGESAAPPASTDSSPVRRAATPGTTAPLHPWRSAPENEPRPLAHDAALSQAKRRIS